MKACTLARAAISSASHRDYEFLPTCGKVKDSKKETKMELRFTSTNL
jgi:hypothetical protein